MSDQDGNLQKFDVQTVEMERLPCGCFPVYMLGKNNLLRYCEHGTVQIDGEAAAKATREAWEQTLKRYGL